MPELWSRLKRAHFVRVLLFYLGASWGVLQIADILQNALSLPDWVTPVTVLLLLVGLVIILTTAWIQAHPLQPARQEAGEVPGSWELGLKEAGQAIASGKLPHLTWGRAILGGVVAFWFLFGLAGLLVVLRGGDIGLGSLGPAEVVADEAGQGIAIVPFAVSGSDLDVWREGMIDLFAANLDGVGGFRAIDARTVLARWRENVDEGVDPDLATVLRVAEETGARFAMVGSAVTLGREVRLSADIYDVSSGLEIGQGQVGGPADEVMTLVDELSVQVMGAVLGQGGGELPPMRNVASVTTASLPALRAFLEGEALFRRSELEDALAAYQRAVAQDSTFALALSRISEVMGWTEGFGDEITQYAERAAALSDRLPERQRIYIEATRLVADLDPSGTSQVEEAVRRFPDDPDLVYMLAEHYVHMGGDVLVGPEETLRMLERAVELDPSFAPYYTHLIETYIALGDSARAGAAIETYDRLTPARTGTSDPNRRRFAVGFSLVFGGPVERAAAQAVLDTLSQDALGEVLDGEIPLTVATLPFHEASLGDVGRRFTEDENYNAELYASLGRLAEFESVLMDAGDEFDQWVLVLDVLLLGLPVSESHLARLRAVNICQGADFGCLIRGLDATLTGDAVRREDMAGRLSAAADSVRSEGDESMATEIEAGSGMIRAFGLWKEGRPAEAIDLLESVRLGRVSAASLDRLWVGQIHAEQGRPREAIPYFESLRATRFVAYAHFRLGQLYEAVGDAAEARANYQDFLTLWHRADEGLLYLDEARAALERLGAGG